MSIKVACTELAKHEPSSSTKFKLVAPTDEKLRQVCNIVDNSTFMASMVDQARIWIYTDHASRDTIAKRTIPGPTEGMIVSDRSGRIIQTSLMSQTGWVELPHSVVQSVCLDSTHRIYAVDQNLDRLTRFNSISGGGVVTFGTSGSGVNQFTNPSSVRFGP